MIQLIPFLAAGALLAFTLYLLLRHAPPVEGRPDDVTDAREALRMLEGGLLPIEMVKRIFAKSDRDYVLKTCPESVTPLFLAERQRIALAWIHSVRRSVQALRRFHNRAARHSSELSFRSEAALARDFAAVLFACRMLEVLIYVGGPFAAPHIVGSTVSAAARLCMASRDSLAFLAPPAPGAIMGPPGSVLR